MNKKIIEVLQKFGGVILLATVYPFGMYLLWKNKKYDKTYKIIQSISCFILWISLIGYVVYIRPLTEESSLQVVEKSESENRELSELIKGEDETLSITEEQSLITIATDNTILEVNEKEIQEQEEIESTINEVLSETEEIEEISSLDVTTKKVSELTFDGESVIDVAIRDMKQYEYIKDVFIEVDEKKKEINIVVQIPSSTDTETAKMAGEDVARYLATMANFANSYYEMPSSNNIGGIYSKYNLIIYIDDGNGNYNIYGAKVTTSNKITWRY
ncbi:MAG TPA: hypothetical protein DEB74_07445 [Lachnospiraceae bacterium]|nr:hypothetical protein [Lachnospiraceae bacterium]